MAAALVVCSLLTPWGAAAAPVAARAGGCTIVGTPGPDVLIGGPGRDVICGRGGDDRLVGGGGDDVLRGGPGRDVLLGRDGKDELVGGAGSDQLRGHGDGDLLRGGRGDDNFFGGPGNDTLRGRDSLAYRDVLACGPGSGDRAFADPPDVVRASCEDVAQNDPPTDLTLVPSSVAENEPEGTDVGELTVADPDPGDTHVVALVAGDGDQDNVSFSIDGSTLVTAASFDFETDPELTVRVRATDEAGAIYEESLTVSVTDVDENRAPVAVADTVSTLEDTPLELPLAGAGSPAANDTDADGDPLTVTAVADATGGSVSIAGGKIVLVPAANLCGVGAAGFTYTVGDGRGGTDDGHVTVDVTCAPDDASAANDTATVPEDAPATVLTVLANDSDADGDPLTIASVTQPTHGTVVLTGGVPGARTGLTYEPDPGYCNSGGGPVDTFTYTLNGGSVATVSVTVTCVDDAPVAVADAATVAEDAVATAVAVLTNDTDPDAGPRTITSATDPANGTVVITAGGSGLTYEPDPNYCNAPPGTTPDTFDYTLNGGSTATVTITVTCVDDDPVAVDDGATLTEDAAAASIAVLGNDTDVDGGPMSVASVTQPDNGTVVITGGGSGLTYQPDANYCNDPAGPAPGDAPDTFDYTLNGGSTATVSVTVTCVDDVPTAVDDAGTVAEDATAAAIDALANDTDVDGGPMSVDSVTQPDNGTVVITGGGSGLTYQPDANYCNSGADPDDTFTYTLNGGSTATVSVTVTCVDDPPTAVDDAATLVKDAAATAVAVLANDTDVDGGPKTISSISGPFNGTVVLTGGVPGAHTGLTYQPDAGYCNDPPGPAPGDVPDTFTYTVNGGSTATVTVTVQCNAPPVAVDDAGTVAEDATAAAIDVLANDTDVDGGPMSVDSVTQPDNGTVVITGGGSGLTYQPDANYCNSGADPDDTFTYTLNGGSTATVSVEVTCVDDPPTAVDDADTVLEDAAATAVPVLDNDTDADGGPKSIGSVTQPDNGTVVITGGGSGLTYEPDANYCNSGAGPDDTFTYTLDGGSSATVSMTVTCVNDAPVADDETFNGNDSAIGNTTMVVNDPTDGAPAESGPKTSVSGDILDGDTDVDGPGPLTVTAGTFATNDGGSVTIQADGDFTFQPAASTSCTDTSDFFDYTVEDSGSPEQTDTGRVTIAIAGCVWYVSNSATGNSGTSSAPFDTLGQAETASGNNHTVFVYDGDGTSTGYSTGYQMNAGERLIGEHEGLVVDPDQGGALTADTLLAAAPGAKPTITASGEDVIALDDGNEVRGFVLDPGGVGGGIAGEVGDTGGATLDDLDILDIGAPGTQPGFELDGTTGTFNVTNLVVSTSAVGVRLNNAGTAVFAPTGEISVTSTGARGLDLTGTALGTSLFDTVTVTGSGSGGVSMVNTTGTTTFTDLSLTTTSGAAGAFVLSNAGTVTVSAAGTANVSATGGPAVDVTGTSGATLAFDDVDSTGSTGDGINLDGLGSGTFSAASGDITGAALVGFDLAGGSGAVTFPGNFGNGPGLIAIDITDRSGGAVVLAGPISDGNDPGGTIRLTGNTGGSTTLSNPIKQVNTGASDGVLFNSSDGHTLTLSGGGLDIDTTTGRGLEADTSSTIAVTGTGNTIDTGTGRGLNISDTDIANAGVTFQSISTNGASNGIRLNNTGNANGRLVLTGDGGTCTSASPATCTGASIQSSTGVGILMNGVPGGASLMRVAVTGSDDDGIQATNVAGGILLDRSAILNNGDAINENGLEYANVHGITTIRSSDIIGTGVNNVGGFGARILNTSGTLHLTVTDTDFNLAGTDDGLQIGAGGTASILTSITGNRFDDNKGDGIQIVDSVSPNVTSHHTITGNTIDGTAGTATDGGIVYSTDGTSRATISNNTITKVSVSGIIVNPLGSAAGSSFDAIASNNLIGTPGVQQSGSEDGDGMQLKSASEGTSRIVMSNNNIRGWQGAGMRLRASEAGGGAATHLTAQGNSMGDEEVGNADAGIWLQAGSSAGDNLNFCANVGGAGALANTFTTAPVTAPAGIADFVLDLRFVNALMRVPNYTGTTETDRQNHFLGRNVGFTNFAQDGVQNMTNEADGACDQPAAPLAPTAPPALGS